MNTCSAKNQSTTRRTVTMLGCALVAGVAAFSPGCIIVSDREVHYRDEPSGPRQGRIGVEIDDTSAALAAQTGADRHRSCVLTGVVAGSPADRAGLKRYDVVTHIDGRDYASPSALREAIRGRREGDTLQLTVVREGKPVTATIPVLARDASNE